MSHLPPLADLVAVRSDDPAEFAAVRAQLAEAAGFQPAWEPTDGWIAASRPFEGGGEPAGEAVRRARLLFAQGLDVTLTPTRDARDLAHLADEHPDHLERVPGDFGFVAFTRGGEATVVRSASGIVPFYVAGAGERVTIATSLALVLRFHPAELGLDPLVNAIWTSGYDAAPDRRTFFTGVRVLGRGEYVRVGRGEPSFGTWWHPRRKAKPAPAGDHAERLRSALVGTLERELDPDGVNLLALSGGVDSSAVGALAGGLGKRLGALTVLPEDSAAQARDLNFIAELERSVELEWHELVEVGADRRIELLDEPAVPFHVMQPYLCLLRQTVAKRQATTLVGGEFADHTVGSTLTLRDWARLTSPAGLWRQRRELPTGRSDLRRWFVWRLQGAMGRPPVPWPDELPEMIRSELREEYSDWFTERRREAAEDKLPLPYLAMFLERQGFLGMHWETTSALGIRRVFPFISRELLELAFELHPSELVGPGTKRLLRSALAGDVPAKNLARPDKGHPGAPAARGPRPLPEPVPRVLEPIFAEGWPPSGDIPYWDVFRTRQLVAFARSYGRARSMGAGHRNGDRDV